MSVDPSRSKGGGLLNKKKSPTEFLRHSGAAINEPDKPPNISFGNVIYYCLLHLLGPASIPRSILAAYSKGLSNSQLDNGWSGEEGGGEDQLIGVTLHLGLQ